MKKLLVLAMALAMSLGVGGEAHAGFFPRGDTPRWATVYEETGTGLFSRISNQEKVRVGFNVARSRGDSDLVSISIRPAGRKDEIRLFVTPGSSTEIRVCWVYESPRGVVSGQECDG